jgi:PKD repeat protein
MPTLARSVALSITMALAVLVAAPAAQAAPPLLSHDTVSVLGTPNDGVLAPGDALVITETVRNDGPSTVTGLTATLTAQTPGVTVTQDSTSYLDIAAGASVANTTPLQATVDPTLACGTTLDFTLSLTNSDGTATVPFTVATGSPGPLVDYTGNPAVIGNSIASLHRVVSAASYAGTALVDDPGIVDEVRVNLGSITHPDISHLALALKAPDGTTTVPLVNAGRGGPGQSFTGTELVQDPGATSLDAPATAPYTGTFKADGDLSAMAGVDQFGTWRLFATEPNPAEIGRINSWTLRIATASCEPRSAAHLTATPNPVDPGANVALDASGSSTVDVGGITRYEWDLGDGTFADGPASRTETFPRGRRTVRVRVSDANGVVGTTSLDLIVSRLPNAVIALPPAPKEQTSVVLDGSGSNDPDGGAIASYAWEVDGDDDFNDSTVAQPSIYFADPGNHTIKLRVTDADGAQRTATATLNVIATVPPVPSIVATPNPVVAGAPVTFDASGSTDDGLIVAYEWDLDGDGSYETAGGPSPLAARSYPNATVMSIGVRVTDDDTRSAVKRVALVVTAPAIGPGADSGAGSPFDAGTPGASGGSGGSGGTGGMGGTSGGGSAGGAGAGGLDADLDGAAIQTLKLVTRKGLGLRCNADRAATCTVSATLAPADARRLGLSRSRTRPYVIGHATVKLKKAGAAVVTVRLARRALARLKRAPRVTVLVTGQAVDGAGRQVALRRAILVRR